MDVIYSRVPLPTKVWMSQPSSAVYTAVIGVSVEKLLKKIALTTCALAIIAPLAGCASYNKGGDTTCADFVMMDNDAQAEAVTALYQEIRSEEPSNGQVWLDVSSAKLFCSTVGKDSSQIREIYGPGFAKEEESEAEEEPVEEPEPIEEVDPRATVYLNPVGEDDTPKWPAARQTKWGFTGGIGISDDTVDEFPKDDGPEPEVELWAPSLPGPMKCDLPLLNTEERSDEEIDMVGTGGMSPMLALMYMTTTKASGLESESLHFWVQTLDPLTCLLGDRIEVFPEGESATAIYGFTYSIVSADSSNVIVLLDNYDLDEYTLIGVNLDSGKQAWSRKVSEDDPWGIYGYTVENIVRHGGDYEDFEAIWTTADGTATTLDGINILSMTESSLNSFLLSTMTNQTKDSERINRFQWLRDGKIEETLEGVGEVAFSNLWIDTSNRGIIGYATSESSPSDMLYFSDGKAPTQILSAEQIESLQAKPVGATHDQVYITTTDENVIVSTTGEDIGRWTDWYPIDDSPIGADEYTFWYNKESNTYAVAFDGNVPQ